MPAIDYDLTSQLTHSTSTGSKAELYKAKRKSDSADVIVKSALIDENSILQKEYKLLSVFNHPNIVKSIDSFTKDNTFCMVMPSYSGGNLGQYFKNDRIVELWKEDIILKIFI